MNKIRIIAIAASGFLAMVTPASLWAQEAPATKHSIELGWGISSPVGQDNFLNKTAYIAPLVSYEYRVIPQLSIGLSVGYLYSKESGLTSDTFNGDIITGQSTRSLSLIPIQATVRYYPLGRRQTAIQPYVGIAAGGSYADFSITGASIQTSGSSNIGTVVTPEIGLRYQTGSKIYVDLHGFMQIADNKFMPLASRCQQSAGVKLGIGYLF